MEKYEDINLIELSEEELASFISDDEEQPDQSTKGAETQPPGSEKPLNEEQQSTENQPDEDDNNNSSTKSGDDKDQEEVKFELNGKEYDKPALEKLVTDFENSQNWQATNTQKSQELASQAKLLTEVRDKFLSDAKSLLEDEAVMDALDEYFGADKNPLRTISLDAKSLEQEGSKETPKEETAAEKELRELREEKQRREQEESVSKQIEKELTEIRAMDKSLSDDDLKKLAEKVGEVFDKEERVISLMEAWVELYGRQYADKNALKRKAKDAAPAAPAKSNRGKTPIVKKPKTIDDAADNALHAYLQMEN